MLYETVTVHSFDMFKAVRIGQDKCSELFRCMYIILIRMLHTIDAE